MKKKITICFYPELILIIKWDHQLSFCVRKMDMLAAFGQKYSFGAPKVLFPKKNSAVKISNFYIQAPFFGTSPWLNSIKLMISPCRADFWNYPNKVRFEPWKSRCLPTTYITHQTWKSVKISWPACPSWSTWLFFINLFYSLPFTKDRQWHFLSEHLFISLTAPLGYNTDY